MTDYCKLVTDGITEMINALSNMSLTNMSLTNILNYTYDEESEEDYDSMIDDIAKEKYERYMNLPHHTRLNMPLPDFYENDAERISRERYERFNIVYPTIDVTNEKMSLEYENEKRLLDDELDQYFAEAGIQ